MFLWQRAILAAGFVCLSPPAMTQQQPNRYDVTHCFAGSASVVAQAQAYNVYSVDIRGTLSAAEQGGALDRHVTRCFSTGGTLGREPNRVSGFCEYAASPEDRILTQWTTESGRGSGRLVAGTGRYRGISGEFSIQLVGGPFPATEPGVVRGCNRLTGEYQLP